jgi:pyocin large subunit-like protein
MLKNLVIFFAARDKLLTKIRPNGEIIVYDAETNIFGVFTNEGIPKTMFKPTDGILYYKRN